MSKMVPLKLSLGAQRADVSLKYSQKIEKDKEKEKVHYNIMFKNGDDLRQDQLILQIIALIDSLLKGVNIDLKLTPYKALACGKTDGFLEFVSNSEDLQSIIKKYGGDMNQYFKILARKAVEQSDSWFYRENIGGDLAKYSEEDGADNQVRQKLIDLAYEKVLANYIDSCAGYCIITYILGIGDRHLENLMINCEGKT